MRNAVSSLLYLELRQLVHRLRKIVKEPKQLILWLAFLGLIALGLIVQKIGPDYSERSTFLTNPGPIGIPLLPSLSLIGLGYIIYRSALRAPGIFTAPADGRFLVGSGLSPKVVVFWLQVRHIIRYLVAYLWLVFWIPTFQRATYAATNRPALFASLTLATLAVLGLRLPVSVAARRWGTTPFVAIGLTLMTAGLAAAGIALARTYLEGLTLASGLGQFAPSFPPGSWIVAAFSGDGLALLVLSALAVALVGATCAVANDSYPELWEASTRAFALRAAAKEGGVTAMWAMDRRLKNQNDEGRSNDRLARRTGSTAGDRVPAGAWTLLWKEWLAWTRRTARIPAPVSYTIIGLVVGIGMGIVARTTQNESFTSTIGGVAHAFFIIAAMKGSARLSGDLGKPIWALSAAPLRDRLAVCILAESLLWTAPVGGAFTAFGIVSGNISFAIWSIPLVGTILWLLYSSSLLMYTGMPAGGLMNPPMMMVRTLGAYLLLIPVGLVAIGTAIIAGLYGYDRASITPLVLMTVTGAGALEGWLLVHLASTRIRDRGLEFVMAEQR